MARKKNQIQPGQQIIAVPQLVPPIEVTIKRWWQDNTRANEVYVSIKGETLKETEASARRMLKEASKHE